MAASSQIEQRLAFEPRTPPVDPAGQTGTAPHGKKPDHGGATSTSGISGGGHAAYSVDISDEAQRIAANDTGNTTRPDTPKADTQQTNTRDDLNATIKTDATASIGSNVSETRSDGSTTNQVTSFESERTGNDTHDETEAGRTLGQVIDTFA